MLRGWWVRSIVAVVGMLALTAFTRPIADGGRDLARSLGKAPVGCARCSDGSSNSHSFPPFGGGAFMHCSSCNSCHENTQAGWCTEYHCGCTVEEEQVTPDLLTQIVGRGSAREVMAFMTRHPNQTYYNAARGVLQVLGCDSRIMAQIAWRPPSATVD